MEVVINVLRYVILATMVLQTSSSNPCTSGTKMWTSDFGITCDDNSIINGKLLFDADITKISYIKFSAGNISSIPPGLFSKFTNIKELELGHCHVIEIQSQSFINLVKLKYLNLVENDLQAVPPLAFQTLTRLEKLDLGHNNISQFSNDSFKGLTGLTVMYLRNNRIKNIPTGSFRDLGLLDGFYIDYNELEELGPGFLEQASKVREIDLSHNKLSKIDPGAFKGLIGLKHLYLNHNNLSTLPGKVFSDLSSLERLRLWHNSLAEFEIGTFDGLHKLEILELEHNKLKVIHENTFHGLVHLEKLELQDNEISSFDVASILKQLQSLTLIKINNNRWNCHALKNFTETLEDKGVEFDGGASYKAANVDGMRCTNDNAFHVSPEDVKEALVDLNLNEYLNNDFKNSSLFKFFSSGYASSNFSDYVEQGFKSSNLYKFFNENFVNSSLYKFLAHDHSETEKFPKTEAFKSEHESTSHETISFTLLSIGITMFIVGALLLVFVVRLIRKHKSEDKQVLVEQNIDHHELSSIQIP